MRRQNNVLWYGWNNRGVERINFFVFIVKVDVFLLEINLQNLKCALIINFKVWRILRVSKFVEGVDKTRFQVVFFRTLVLKFREDWELKRNLFFNSLDFKRNLVFSNFIRSLQQNTYFGSASSFNPLHKFKVREADVCVVLLYQQDCAWSPVQVSGVLNRPGFGKLFVLFDNLNLRLGRKKFEI